MEDTHNYSLSFKVFKKNLMPVDIASIDNEFVNLDVTSIEVIDAFTSKYTFKSLMELVRNSNTLTEDYLLGELLIIDNTTGWRYIPILKNGFGNNELLEFLISNKSNKNIMNKLYNKASNHIKSDEYKKYCKRLFLEETDLKEFLFRFKELPYLIRRDIKILSFNLSDEELLIED